MTWEEYTHILDNGPTENKPKQRHRSPEHDIQVSCINWFKYKYPNILIWANGNGGERNRIVAARMKAEGVKAGLPDITIGTARKGYHGLYVEMKNGKKNNCTPEQKEFIERLNNEGYLAIVCRSFDEFEKAVTEYLE